MDTNGEELSMPLPEELVERILATVPFPQIFKAQALSKSWRARFSSISSQDDEETKLLALSFQKRVCERSDKWKTYYPVFLFGDFLFVYDRASQHWHKVPTLSIRSKFLKETVGVLTDNLLAPATIVGSLLLVRTMYPYAMFVINIFTGSWKKLPSLPSTDRSYCTPTRLVSTMESYKVITLDVNVSGAHAWIYDSKLGAWRNKTFAVPEVLRDCEVGWHDVDLNGVVHVMIYAQRMIWGFLAFDLEKETFHLIHMPPTRIIPNVDWRFLQPVACNRTLYIVVPEKISLSNVASRPVTLLEVDLVSRRWLKLIRGPPSTLKFVLRLHKAYSDGECLLFQGFRDQTTSGREILAYNVQKDEWSYFSMSPILKQSIRFMDDNYAPYDCDSSFRPGMNPFLEA